MNHVIWCKHEHDRYDETEQPHAWEYSMRRGRYGSWSYPSSALTAHATLTDWRGDRKDEIGPTVVSFISIHKQHFCRKRDW